MQLHQFHELAQSFADGFRADAIVLACAKRVRHKPLNDKDLTALKQAEELLSQAIKGYHWLDKPFLDDTVHECAKSFSQAIQAFCGVYINTSKEKILPHFVEYLQGLKETATQLRNGNVIPEEEIQALRLFFFFISFSEMIKTDEILNPS